MSAGNEGPACEFRCSLPIGLKGRGSERVAVELRGFRVSRVRFRRVRYRDRERGNGYRLPLACFRSSWKPSRVLRSGRDYGRFGGRAGIAEFTELRWITIATQAQHYPI